MNVFIRRSAQLWHETRRGFVSSDINSHGDLVVQSAPAGAPPMD